MPKLFLPRHGRTHCRGGSDPIPCLTDMAVGEMYKESTQIISSGGFEQVTAFDQWNISNADVINQATNALTIMADGYYMVSASCAWSSQPTNATLTVEVSPNPYGFIEDRDELHSQAIESRLVNRLMTFLWLPASSDLLVYVEHFSGSSRTINTVTLRVASMPTEATAPFYA